MAPPHDRALEIRTAPRGRVVSLWRTHGASIAGFGLPYVLVLYLALRGGGYDSVVRGEVAVAAWWIVGLGALVGALPVIRPSRSGWVALGLLVAFCVWTAFGIGWTESTERTVAEVGRVAGYAGIFALALLGQGRSGIRLTVSAVAAAIATTGVLALLSRLEPDLFPASVGIGESVRGAEARLSWPLDYWNGLGALFAMGVPLLLCLAVSARHVVARALSAAAVPALVLAIFLTFSRGGAVELAVALIVLVAFHPRRLALAVSLALTSVGGGLAVLAAGQREAVLDRLSGSVANAESSETLLVVLVVCTGVGLLQAAVALIDRYGVGPRVRVGRRATGIGWAAAALVAIVVGIAAGLPQKVGDAWEGFKDPVVEDSASSSRLLSESGTGRYQLWGAALDANATDPLKGVGAGTYEYWWAANGDLPVFVRDAHSLYLEALAETGIVGFLLIGGTIAFVLAAGAWRTVRAKAPSRVWLAGALAAAAAFAFAAGIDWMWELTVVPVAFLLLAAVLLAAKRRDLRPRSGPPARLVSPSRLGLGLASLLGLAAVAIPLAADSAIEDSRAEATDRQFEPALESASRASQVQPYAATPALQRALVLEVEGDLDAAAAAATEATEAEPVNWRNWLTLSRIEAKRGEAEASVDAYRRARELNPRSPLFARGTQ